VATNVYTSDYSLAAVRRRGLIPTAGKLTETDLLGFLNDATQDFIVPILMSVREGFLLATEDTALVSGQTDYAMPPRASAERLYRVLLVASNGDETALDRVETARKASQQGFELVDNTIALLDPPSGYASLRIEYFRMPNRLVALTSACKVTAKTSTTVTVDDIPATFTTSEPLDFISGVAGFRWRAIDKTPTAVDQVTNILTFASGDVPSSLAVGDFIALAGETPIMQIPQTLHPLAHQAACCMALEALGDGKLGTAMKTLDATQKRLVPTLATRVPGAPRVIINRYAQGSYLRRLPRQFR
jgi:hypothetical protein